MNEWILIGSIAFFLGIRAASFIRFWRIPFFCGAEKFFGLPLAPEMSKPLLRRYRTRLMLAYLPDALCAPAAYLWGGLIGLAFQQIAGAIVTRTLSNTSWRFTRFARPSCLRPKGHGSRSHRLLCRSKLGAYATISICASSSPCLCLPFYRWQSWLTTSGTD